MKHLLLAATLAVTPNIAMAEVNKELVNTMVMEFFKSQYGEDVLVESYGDWTYYESKNPIDDSKTVKAILEAYSGTGKYGDSIYLQIRCMDDETDVIIDWESYLGSKAYVTSRVDKNKAVTIKWSLSTDSKSVFSPHPHTLTRELFEAKKFVAQITPYNENPITAKFNLEGIDKFLPKLVKTCNWAL